MIAFPLSIALSFADFLNIAGSPLDEVSKKLDVPIADFDFAGARCLEHMPAVAPIDESARPVGRHINTSLNY
jgi:hypothetical protein